MSKNKKENSNVEHDKEIKEYFKNIGNPKILKSPIQYKDKTYTKIQNVQPMILLRSNALCGCGQPKCHYITFYKIVENKIDGSDTLPIIGAGTKNCHCLNHKGVHIINFKDEDCPICVDIPNDEF